MTEHMYCDVKGEKTENPLPAPATFFSPGLTVSGKKHKSNRLYILLAFYAVRPKNTNLCLVCVDLRMQVTLLYQGQRVMIVTTSSPDGCFILQGPLPWGNERIYGPCTAQQLSFPSPGSVSLPSCMAEAMNRLLCHLERGVLLWVAPDGVFIKRFCQGRVYWSGPLAQHTDAPNKLDREKTFKLLDIPRFVSGKATHEKYDLLKEWQIYWDHWEGNEINVVYAKRQHFDMLNGNIPYVCAELQRSLQGKGPAPSYEIELCFGEEYPDPHVPKTRKLIMAQVSSQVSFLSSTPILCRFLIVDN